MVSRSSLAESFIGTIVIIGQKPMLPMLSQKAMPCSCAFALYITACAYQTK